MSNRLPRSAVSRLALVAIDVLDEAYRTADRKPIERTAIHRLALGYLLLSGLASKGHVRTIWQVLGHEGLFVQMPCRQSHFGNIIHGIRERARGLYPGEG